MNLEAHASIEVPRTVEKCWAYAIDVNAFQNYALKHGPIPAALHGEMIDGPMRSGARRRMAMSDGTSMEEEILAFDVNQRYQYRWLRKPNFPFSLLVKGAQAEWRFSPSAKGTRVEWDYALTMTTPLVWPLAKPVVILFRQWMQKALERFSAQVQ